MSIIKSKEESSVLTSVEKLCNLIGLAQRAGCLVSGEEQVIKAIQTQKAQLVFLASDAKSNLTKKITDKGKYYQIEVSTVLTTLQLSASVGKARKVLAITDAGFSKKMRTLMND